MGIFGWSYPAGCNGPPDDEPCGCNVCFLEVGSCICPECPVCGEAGEPTCYIDHGMVRSPEQVASHKVYEAAQAAEDACYEMDEDTIPW